MLPAFGFAVANFDDGSLIRLGIWGACYVSAQGATTCTGTSVGYNWGPTGLPYYSVNQGLQQPFVVFKACR